MKSPKTIIIGGGLAGIAAATSLLKGKGTLGTPHGKKHHQVTLIDQRSFLGGRSYSYSKPDAPELDNGHHVTLGCYRNLKTLLSLIAPKASTPPIQFQNNLQLHYRGHDDHRPVEDSLRTASLFAPLNLLAGLLRMRSLSRQEKWLACKIGPAVQRRNTINEGQTATSWLQSIHQSQRLINCLWEPLCSAALNRHPDQASAKLFAEVLHQAFFIHRDDAAIGIFNGNLSTIIGKPAAQFIGNNGGNLALGKTVTGLLHSGNRITGVRLEDGSELSGDDFICAVPHHRIMKLLSESLLELWPAAHDFAKIESSPIVNVYLTYAAKPFDLPFCCLLGGTMQWAFDVSHLLKDNPEKLTMISLTVSDARHLLDTANDELAKLAHRELQAAFPKVCPKEFVQAWVIKERRATMDHSPAQEKLRPGPLTPFENLYLAGDWTATKLPCTLEGACVSGFRAAEIVRRKYDRNNVEVVNAH